LLADDENLDLGKQRACKHGIVDILSDHPEDAYDRDRVYEAAAERDPGAAVVVPPRKDAVASASAESDPTQRDHHLRMITERGGMAWQISSSYNLRAKVEASIRGTSE
jgi:hypothetical protein